MVVCKALTSLGVFWVLFVASCSPSFGLALCLATPPTVVILANYHCEQEKRMPLKPWACDMMSANCSKQATR